MDDVKNWPICMDGPLEGQRFPHSGSDNIMTIQRPGKLGSAAFLDPETPDHFKQPVYRCEYQVIGKKAYYLGEVHYNF